HRITSEIWYRLLNCGFRLPAGAGTDAFPNFASLRGPPGLVRVFVKTGAALDHARWLAAIKAGRTFVSNAPLLEFTLGGGAIGDGCGPLCALDRAARAGGAVRHGVEHRGGARGGAAPVRRSAVDPRGTGPLAGAIATAPVGAHLPPICRLSRRPARKERAM